jgi:formylglycine-generating enzyme required for sulfatase activity
MNRRPPKITGVTMSFMKPSSMRPHAASLVLALGFLVVPMEAAISAEDFRDCETCPTMVKMASGPSFAKYHVTRQQFAVFAATQDPIEPGCSVWDDKGFHKGKDATWQEPGFEQGGDHPVLCVSWLDATAYADWLSEETGKIYRLPTIEEATAAIGGDGEFSWGDGAGVTCRYANVGDKSLSTVYPSQKAYFDCDDGFVHTSPVGSFEPNAFGLYDMNGNVWQWTNSCLKGDCANALFRGGAWNGIYPGSVKRETSFGDRIVLRGVGVGFRVVRDEE